MKRSTSIWRMSKTDWKDVWNFTKSLLIASLFAIIIIPFTASCDGVVEETQQEKRCVKIIGEYHKNYNNFLHYKYDDKYFSSITYISPPPDYIEVKLNCPELYDEFILPLKTEWDSLLRIPKEVTLYEGVSENVLNYNLKIKELEKYRVKMKKSDGSDINIGDDIYVMDSTQINK